MNIAAFQIDDYDQEVVLLVSCVTKDPPYRPHPHKLVGKDLCKDGILKITLKPGNLKATFRNLGIQCVKRKDVKEALQVRENLKIDPFGSKYIIFSCIESHNI